MPDEIQEPKKRKAWTRRPPVSPSILLDEVPEDMRTQIQLASLMKNLSYGRHKRAVIDWFHDRYCGNRETGEQVEQPKA